MFFAAVNLTTQSVQSCVPWEFKTTETITEQIRHIKEERQRWYQNPATQHCFYTAIEATSAAQRVSKDNPPRMIHGFVADYDINVPAERIVETIRSMEIKPTYFETSLGGKFRFVWVMENPLPVDSRDFCSFILREAHDWLRLGLLPGLDRKAFEETSRLYCNGCVWEATGAGPIPRLKSQAFFVDCGRKFRFKAGDDENVPLDIVEKALKERFPNFNWPGPFELETQGPSFWVPGSTSTQSAIVKSGGLFSFANHAAKPFYSWSDILGKEFTEAFQADAIARATEDIWWDGKKYWRKVGGFYRSLSDKELLSYFKVSCRLSSRAGKGGISAIDQAMEHVFNHQWITGAAPFVFRPTGLLVYDGERKLNTYAGTPVQPASDKQEWGPRGGFPFISRWLDTMFVPHTQLPHVLAWFKHYYTCAFSCVPRPGQNSVFMGGTNIGKTLLNRQVVGVGVGGFVDASDFLVMGGQFNSHLMKKPHWVLDDDSPAGSQQAINHVHMMFKKIAANQQFLCNTKFEAATMTEWMGRIGCTTNLDFLSSRIVGPLDNNSLDKLNLFRCCEKTAVEFPDRLELEHTLSLELPKFLRWVLDWEPPDSIERDRRYGYRAHHEKTLLDQSYQSSNTATFKEVLIEFLFFYFRDNSEAKYWEGTVSMLVRQLSLMHSNEFLLRSMKMEQTSRYLEQLSREGSIKCEVLRGMHNTRVWRFFRIDGQLA